MDLAGGKFAVIGGAGLIGSHTVDLLLKHEVSEIVVYDNFSRGRVSNLTTALNDSRVSVFPAGGDIMHTDTLARALSGCDGAFHFAALWLLQCAEFPRSAFDVNVRGTFNVIEACLAADVGRLVFSSSGSVYGDPIEDPIPESHPYLNKTFYGASKIAGEHLLSAMAASSHGKLAFAGLRYMNVYGPRQHFTGTYTSVVAQMISRLEAGMSPQIHGDGSQSFDFVHVRDCARANVLAMAADHDHGFYNIGTGVRTSIRKLAEMLTGQYGRCGEIESIPAPRGFVTSRVADTRRAQTELGFVAEIGLDEGLKETVSWRRSLGVEGDST